MTRSENIKHAFKIGLAKAKRKLSADDVRYIRQHYKKGSHEFGAKPLARKFKVCENVIENIVSHKTYNDVI